MTELNAIFPQSRSRFRPTQAIEKVVSPLIFIVMGLCASVLYSEIAGVTALFKLGSFTLHVMDIPIFYALCYLVLIIKDITNSNRLIAFLFLLFTLVLFVNFVRGLSEDGQAALLSARFFSALGLIPIIAAISRVGLLTLKRVFSVISAFAALTALVALIRIATVPNLFMVNGISAYEVNDGGRPLSAVGAYFLLTNFWICFSHASIDPKARLTQRVSATLSAIGAIVSLQGTVIIALFVTMLLFIILSSYKYHKLMAVGFLFTAPFVIYFSYQFSDFINSFAFVAHRLDNVGTRQEVWNSFGSAFSDANYFDQLFGWPLGRDLELQIMIGDSYTDWTSSLHSMYFGAIKVAGLAAIPTFFLGILIILVKFIGLYSRHNIRVCLHGAMLLISLFIFFYSYEANFGTSIAIMCAILLIRCFGDWAVGDRQS